LHKVIAVSGNTTIRFSVPWKQQQPFLITSPFYAVGGGIYPNFSSNGQLGIYCINPMTSNGSTDPIYINTYVSSQDIKFTIPYQDRILNSSIVLTSSDMVPVSSDKARSTNLDYHLRYFGEDVFTSVKNLCSKIAPSTLIVEATETFTGGRRLKGVFRVGNVPSAIITGDYAAPTPLVSYLDYFALAYVGIRGSLNYSFNPAMDQLDHATSIFPSVFVANNITSDTAPQLNNNVFRENTGIPTLPVFLGLSQSNYTYGYRPVHPCTDFTVPHYSPGYFRPTLPVYINSVSNLNSFPESISIAYSTSSTLASTSVLSNGLGDDGLFIGFRGMPAATYSAVI